MISKLSLLLLLLVVTTTSHAADFVYPLDVTVDKDGTMYVADRKLPGIWKVNAEGEATVLVKGLPNFGSALNAIRCVHVTRDGTLLAGDSATREIYKVSTDDGTLTPLTGENRDPITEIKSYTDPKERASHFGMIGIPMCIADDSQGNLYVTDVETHRVWKVPKEGGEPTEFAVVAGPRGITVDADDNVWVQLPHPPQLVKYDADGNQTPVVTERVFNFAHQVAVDEQGTAYVSDGYEKAIWKVSPDGKAEKLASGEPFVNPVGIALSGDSILVADPRANAIFKVAADGKVTTVVSGKPAE